MNKTALLLVILLVALASAAPIKTIVYKVCTPMGVTVCANNFPSLLFVVQ